MANPLYHDDPEWYERPGETVLLEVDKKPTVFTVGKLPWSPVYPSVSGESGHTQPCIVCGKVRPCVGGVCGYCQRAQHRDETHLARARQPHPSGPRIHSLREGWER